MRLCLFNSCGLSTATIEYSSLSVCLSVYMITQKIMVMYKIFLILSRLNDLTRCFNVDIMMLYISVRDHARKLKFSSYVHLPSVNKMFQYRYP